MPDNGRFTPAYLRISESALKRKAETAESWLADCMLCPRRCGVDRTSGEKGFCRTLDKAIVSSWGPHFGEEAPLVGLRGSGTIFFTNCNLGCVFCQNWAISHGGEGREMAASELAAVMVELQETGCHNINLVTPTHQIPMILRALLEARGRGLRLPVVYNCGGYESLDAIQLLEDVVDIYMPDFKFASSEAAKLYAHAPDYPERAREALREMHRQVGDLVTDARGIALRGLLVRHLVLPGGLAGTHEVVRFIGEEISKDTYLNVMDQYRPCYRAFKHPPLNRRLSGEEFAEAVSYARKAGLKRLDGITV